jgi:glycerol-3-phosphate dehydrogenase (NAD(P)+)
MRITVYGAGAWGTALASAHAARHSVTLWLRDAQQAEAMRRGRENRRYFPGHPLPASLRIETDLARAAADAELNLIATPVSGLRDTVAALAACATGVPVIWACKGLEAQTGRFPHQVVAEVLGDAAPCGALSGPSFAEEVARGLPTAVTLASSDLGLATRLVQALNTPRLRLYANDDLIGVEVGGAVKNVLAIATGISDGMGFGLNARAALMTRGLAEIARLGAALGGQRETFMGLAGMGDLILTCTGDLSRNRRVGLGLARGKRLDEVLAELGHTAEGVGSAREVARLAARLGVDMPIAVGVKAILFDGLGAKEAVEQLLARDPKIEHQHVPSRGGSAPA